MFPDYNGVKLGNNNKYFCNIIKYLGIKEHILINEEKNNRVNISN